MTPDASDVLIRILQARKAGATSIVISKAESDAVIDTIFATDDGHRLAVPLAHWPNSIDVIVDDVPRETLSQRLTR